LTTIAKASAGADGFLHPFGIPISPASFFPYIISFSVLLQFLFLPLFGSLADFTQKKKLLLGVFAYIGALSTMGLYFVESSNYYLGGILFIIANFSFGISSVMYNAYLNEIAEPSRRDAVSSIGWAFGYLGGGVLLAINLVIVMNASALNISTAFAIRICLLSAGTWWALFTIVPMLLLRSHTKKRILPKGENLIKIGFKELFKTIKNARNYPKTVIFLIAFLLYNDGVQSVIALAAVFGQEELKMDISTLTIIILMVQFVAFGGSLLFQFISKQTGTKNAILISILIWIGAIIYAYSFLRTETGFFILAAVIGIVLGSTQALSRSLYSQLIPFGKEAEYFSLYEISDKGTSWLGPLVFGLALQFTGSYRLAILSLLVFFIIGFTMLWQLNIEDAIKKMPVQISPDIT
jgi:UMF1 family MFS transporter